MEERDSLRKKHWVSLDKRQECLALFQEGNGYKSTATMTGGGTPRAMTHGHTGKGYDALYGDINARALGNGSPIHISGSCFSAYLAEACATCQPLAAD